MAEDIRRCIYCGERQRAEESLQRDFDGVLDERIGLQVAMRQAIDISASNDPAVRNRVRLVLEEALAVLDVVVENHPKPELLPSGSLPGGES